MYEGVNQTRKINNSLMAHVFKRKPQREYLLRFKMAPYLTLFFPA